MFKLLLEKYLRLKLLANMEGIHLISKKLPKLLSKWLYYFTLTLTLYENSNCSTSSPVFIYLYDFNCCGRSLTVPHSCFSLHFSNDQKYWAHVSMCMSTCMSSLWCFLMWSPFFSACLVFFIIEYRIFYVFWIPVLCQVHVQWIYIFLGCHLSFLFFMVSFNERSFLRSDIEN